MVELKRVCFVALYLLVSFDTANAQAKKAKVLVLGAGLSGVMAAKTLTDNGIDDFLVLEGSDRVGGRMEENDELGYNVEVGAQWIVGGCLDETVFRSKPTDANTKGCNPILSLANKYGMEYQATKWDSFTAKNSTGGDVTSRAQGFYKQFNTALEDAEDMAVENLAKDKPDTSLKIGLNMAGLNVNTPLKRIIEYWELDTEFAVPVDETSLNFNVYWAFTHFGDYELYTRSPQGYSYIPQQLMTETLGNNTDKLIFNSVVTKIEHSDSSVTVTTSTGDIYVADYVIVTFSIGVLQSDAVTFVPALPSWKRESIFEFQMAHYSFVYLKFNLTFWEDTEWIIYANDISDRYPVWFNFNHVHPGCNIVQATVVEDEAMRSERQTDEEVWAELRAQLVKMYPNVDIPDIHSGMVRSNHSTNPLQQGAFSNWAIGYPKYLHDALKREVGRVFFAGEALSMEYFGYVLGAYRAGIDQTKRLLQCMETPCPAYVPPYDAKGCTYTMADNYNKNAQLDDGSCVFTLVTGGQAATFQGIRFHLSVSLGIVTLIFRF